MDIESTDPLGALLDEAFPDEIAADAPPETPASVDGSDEPVAATDVQAEAAVADESPSVPAPPDPQPDYAAQLEAMQAQLAEVGKKAEQFDQLQQLAQQRAAEAAEQEQFAAWQKRMEELEDLSPAKREAEQKRILSEVRQYQARQAQARIEEGYNGAAEQAKINTALYLASQAVLTPEQRKAQEDYSKYLLNFDSPEAMQSYIERETQVRNESRDTIAALKKQVEELTLAVQAKDRIASGADLVGAGAGAPAKGDPGASFDDWFESVVPFQ